MEETKNLIGNYASKAAQSTLLRSVYVWMTLALVITGFVSMYVAQSYQLVSFIFGNRLALWGMLIAELAVVFYLSARINSISFTKATVMFIIYSILNGATLASIFLVYTMSSIASTFFVAAGTFGVMALYGYVTKSDLTRIGNICLMALIGINHSYFGKYVLAELHAANDYHVRRGNIVCRTNGLRLAEN